MSPYELLHGRTPRTSFDWNTPKTSTTLEALNQEKARAIASRMENAIEVGRSNMKQAQARMERNANAHRRPVDFDVGDKAYVSTKPWQTQRPSRKLDHQMAGPFPITEKVGNSYKIDLPASIKVHNVIPPDRLRKAVVDPLPGQVNDPPPPIVVTGEQEWEVEEILASKILRKKLMYRVKWIGHDEDLNWYPAADFKYAPHKLREYHLQNRGQAGPPALLREWIREWEAGNENYEELEDNKPMTTSLRASFFEEGG
jgi:hypothetical protein